MRFFYLCIFAGLFFACNSNKSATSYNPKRLPQQVAALADSVASDNYIGTRRMGRLPQDAPAYLRRQRLMVQADSAASAHLLQHPNPVVQLVAFENMAQKWPGDVPQIMEEWKQRTQTIQYIKGDISTEMPLLAYAYTYILHYTLPGEELPGEIEDGRIVVKLGPELQKTIEQQIAAIRNPTE